MSTTDEVLGSIDHALRDFDTSDDAMRWTPEPAKPPERRTRGGVVINSAGYIMRSPAMARPNVSVGFLGAAFIANSERFRAAMEKLAEVLNTTGPDITRLLWGIEVNERETRSHALWTAYHARHRTRRNR